MIAADPWGPLLSCEGKIKEEQLSFLLRELKSCAHLWSSEYQRLANSGYLNKECIYLKQGLGKEWVPWWHQHLCSGDTAPLIKHLLCNTETWVPSPEPWYCTPVIPMVGGRNRVLGCSLDTWAYLVIRDPASKDGGDIPEDGTCSCPIASTQKHMNWNPQGHAYTHVCTLNKGIEYLLLIRCQGIIDYEQDSP